jgi:hypothetical protein
MPTWPAGLPQSPDSESYGEDGPFPVVQAPVDGPPLSRRRFTAQPVAVTARYMFSTAELATFETFWKTDLKHGSLTFDGPTRGNGAVISTYRATGPYKLTHASCGYWFVTIPLIRLP